MTSSREKITPLSLLQKSFQNLAPISPILCKAPATLQLQTQNALFFCNAPPLLSTWLSPMHPSQHSANSLLLGPSHSYQGKNLSFLFPCSHGLVCTKDVYLCLSSQAAESTLRTDTCLTHCWTHHLEKKKKNLNNHYIEAHLIFFLNPEVHSKPF